MTTQDDPAVVDDLLPAAFVAATSALVCVIDGDGRVLLANPALQRFTGRTVDELVGRLFYEIFIVPEHVLLAQDAVARAMASGIAAPQEGDWLDAGGRRRRVALQNDVLLDADGRPWAIACLGLDVTDRRRSEEQLRRRAQTDLLTGLSNRGALFDVLRRHLGAGGRGCGLLFCDLDDFKAVNDRHGHAVGDSVLVRAAARLQELAGPEDLVARFGGDEFVVVCPDGDEQRLRALAARVLADVRLPVAGPHGDLVVGVSVGWALADPGEEADDLIARADHAMYGVKTQQRRRRPRTGG